MFSKKHISSFVVQFSRSNSLPALADSFVIISPSFPFVNTFLKVFQNFFDFVFWGDLCLSTAWLFYHFVSSLSSTFSEFFSFPHSCVIFDNFCFSFCAGCTRKGVLYMSNRLCHSIYIHFFYHLNIFSTTSSFIHYIICKSNS